jgi:FkbM family methyltransferase
MKNLLKKLVPRPIRTRLLNYLMYHQARQKGFEIRQRGGIIEISTGERAIRLSIANAVYISDILGSFDYYYCAVSPLSVGDKMTVDYSGPRYHEVTGFTDYPILFPSFAEPIITTEQYLDFAALREGDTVLDLGAYSGLTSIVFAKKVGQTGKVIAVDADPCNIMCIKKNVGRFQRDHDNLIDILEGAVWINDEGILFSSEGNMGSSAVIFVGRNRGALIRVPSFTLSQIADRYDLKRVDFIKCDVEGAERDIFKDDKFFDRYAPRIIVEVHLVDGDTTAKAVENCLASYGYSCKKVEQQGVSLPLLECTPPSQNSKWQGP